MKGWVVDQAAPDGVLHPIGNEDGSRDEKENDEGDPAQSSDHRRLMSLL